MDLETAKELDKILNWLKEQSKKDENGRVFIDWDSYTILGVRFQSWKYTRELVDYGLIKRDSPNDLYGRGYYNILIEGESFKGFEQEIKIESRNKIINRLFEYSKPLVGVIVGWLLSQYLTKDQQKNVNVTLESPKVQVVHDTIYLLNQKNIRDTALVRIVKSK